MTENAEILSLYPPKKSCATFRNEGIVGVKEWATAFNKVVAKVQLSL